MKSFKAQIYVSTVCIVLGLMLAYQFKAVKQINISTNTREIEGLKDELKSAQKQKEEYESKIKELEKQLQGVEEDIANSSDNAKSLKDDLDRIRMFAGLTAVQGPGIIITVAPLTQEINNALPAMPVDYVDLLIIINELNASGAEAITINDRRVVNATQIRSVTGDFISINGDRFSAREPFTIKALGDPAGLETALNMTGGVTEGLAPYVTITIQKVNNMTLYKYNKAIKMPHATAVKEGE
jgi:uncharacterized protein YlxW (UPF0749 family)